MGGTSPQQAAQSLGFSYTKKAPAIARKAFAKAGGVTGSGTIRHYIEGSIEGRALRIGQHEYMLSTGSAVIPIIASVYLLDAPDWPLVVIRRRLLLSRLLRAMGRRDRIQLDSDAFNRELRVQCDDEPFAVTILSPEAQALILEKPSIRWTIGGRRIAMVYAGSLKGARIAPSLDRLRRFVASVPDELWSWTAPPPPRPA